MLFQRITCSHTFEWYNHYFRRPLALVFSRILCFFETATFHPVFQRYWVYSQFSCSHPFDEWLFCYHKRVIAATHFFNFTVLLQNRNCSKKISYILIMILPWFKSYIYWKKSVTWRHHFRQSVFSMIVSLFYASTWSDPHVKDFVFISQYLLQPSIITSSLWLIRENLKGMFIERKPL